MRIIPAFIVIVGLAGGGPAYAQSTGPSFSGKSSGQAPVNAPVGHRQPRPGEVPPPGRATTDMPTGSVDNSPRPDTSDADERLNRALNSICRGC